MAFIGVILDAVQAGHVAVSKTLYHSLPFILFSFHAHYLMGHFVKMTHFTSFSIIR